MTFLDLASLLCFAVGLIYCVFVIWLDTVRNKSLLWTARAFGLLVVYLLSVQLFSTNQALQSGLSLLFALASFLLFKRYLVVLHNQQMAERLTQMESSFRQFQVPRSAAFDQRLALAKQNYEKALKKRPLSWKAKHFLKDYFGFKF